ncbi:uncharacterized protein LOC119381920 [Rhipicephalus sanguineus]|uniref:uncharacterized protein LOC119381920 n=1 Tax=Rhipicephalus sanguineus TaxID=34632 RepID=UPI0018948AC5|nr:uncharacterized protein LOC119381920 [Rhipicephalus sanguineus]
MKSSDGRSYPNVAAVKKNAGKKLSKNANLALNSNASSGAKVSKATGAARSNENPKPSLSTSSSSKASASGKASKAPSVVHSGDASLKAGAREGGATKTPISGERIASREPSGTAVEKDRANTTDGKTNRADKAPSDSGRPKNRNDGGTKAVAEDDETSLFGSAESVVFVTAQSDQADGNKQKLPRQEVVTKKKDKVVTKETDVPSPAVSSTRAPPAVTEEKAPAALDVEAKAKAAKASDKRPSTSSTKSNAKNREVKSDRKKRSPSRGNKAVQTNPDEEKAPAGPPMHVLFSPSSCSLCERNAPPPGIYGAMQSFQVGKYGAVMAAPPAVTTAQGPPRGVVKKTVRTTTTTRRVPDSTRTSRSFNLVEEVTTEDVRNAADDTYKTKSTTSASTAGKGTNGGASKKTVSTMRRRKDRDKRRKSSDTSSGVEGTITEAIEFPVSEAKRGSVEKQTDGAKPMETTVLESSAKKNAASVAPKTIVRTVRRAKNADSLYPDDVIETVTTEVVEVEAEASPAQPAKQIAAPTIVGVARGSSATHYRYSESRRPASTPYRAPHRSTRVRVGSSSDPSEGTYDVFYEGEPDPVPANASGIRNDVSRRPTEFIWETPPREEVVYCANLMTSPTAHAANGRCGATCNEDANVWNQDGVDARTAPAGNDLSMTAGSQVTTKSQEETLFFF